MASGTESVGHGGRSRRTEVDAERGTARSTADRDESGDAVEGSDREGEDANAGTEDAAELFVAITGTSTFRSTQRTDAHESMPDARERRDYKRQHDALARHEALRDAIEQPDVGE